MTPDSRQRLLARIALATGALLFILALRYTDWDLIVATGPRLAVAAAASIAISGVWHLARTIAWATCFPATRRLPLSRLFRVRLTAEAVSYVTVRGVAGEPLKVLLLGREVDARTATAAVALERAAYIIGTALIVGIGATVAVSLLPLSLVWRRAFLLAALGSLLFACGAGALVFAGRRAGSLEGGERKPATTVLAKCARFISDVARRMAALAHGDPRRLAILALMTATSYALMAFEAWAVFRLAGVPVSIAQAIAIETFTRVASVASAAIPANLGALEAASLAASAAVGGPTGAFLALTRRLRGLFWAAAGFAVYPRNSVTTRPPLSNGPSSPSSGPVLLYVADDPRVDVLPTECLAGLPMAERVLRAAVRAGYERILVFAPATSMKCLQTLHVGVVVARDADEWRRHLAALPGAMRVSAIGPGTVVSSKLLRTAALLTAPSPVVADVPAGPAFPISGLIRTSVALSRDVEGLADVLCDRVWRASPSPSGEDVSHGRAQLAIRAESRQALSAAEKTMRRATFKETDAKVARFNRRLSLPISIALLRTPVTANAMSIFVFALGMVAAWMFSRGNYVAGAVGAMLSLAASVLDGCDGEIARLKYQESALGCWLETIGDYSYYLAIFAGLTVGAVAQTGWPLFFRIGAVGLAGTVLSFLLLIFLRRRITEGRPETLHAVAKARFKADPSWWSVVVWRVSFVATRAAMPYGILVLALANLLPVVVVLSAIGANVYWVSLALKLRHLLGEPSLEPSPAVVTSRLSRT